MDLAAFADLALKRNALAHDLIGQHTVVAAAIRQAFDQPDKLYAGETWPHVVNQLRLAGQSWLGLWTRVNMTCWPTLVVFAAVLSWAKNRRKISVNPLEKIGRIYRGTRAEFIWTEQDETAFMLVASEPLRLAMLLALWTGQRQGDLLKLTWAAYDSKWIKLTQGKTGERISIPVGAPLRAVLAACRT